MAIFESAVSEHGTEPVGINNSERCFHCDRELEKERVFHATIDDIPRTVCSQRCAEVATAIEHAGLARFYRERRNTKHLPQDIDQASLAHFAMYDEPAFETQFVDYLSNRLKHTSLLIDGITCAACVRLVESRLHEIDGIKTIAVNATTHRGEVSWDADKVKLSDIMREVYRLGYTAFPFDPSKRQLMLERDRKTLLQRVALSLLFGMQIMMFTFALYYGDWLGMSPGISELLRWTSLVLALPLMSYCALPFYRGALRGLRNRHLGMDVPVSLALAIAFISSAAAVIGGSGHTYFESIAMFVALLLLSRYFELASRIKATRQFDDLSKVLPNVATRLKPDGSTEAVMAETLNVDDTLLVRAGEVIPVDGVIVAGTSTVDEALISGESMPVPKRRNCRVVGGSINIESPIQIRVSHCSNESLINEISRLAQRAQALKPGVTILANRIASWFILGVISVATAVAFYWWTVDPSRALAITMAVLIISCPCALALATPAAMTAASGAMLRTGVAVVNPTVIETLAEAKRFIFDKTGTLTTGELTLARLVCYGEAIERRVREIVAALGLHSEHTIGRALRDAAGNHPPIAYDVHNHPGAGITATIDETQYWLGSQRFVCNEAKVPASGFASMAADTNEKSTYLAKDGVLLAALFLKDELKPGAHELLAALRDRGAEVAILSGDTNSVAQSVGSDLGIDDVRAGLRPEDKLRELTHRQGGEDTTVVIGDGINDAPMMAQAYVSIAVDNASDLAKRQADIILLSEDLKSFQKALTVSRKTMRIIRQNIIWAIGYNSCALPLAIGGFVPPWLAAIGMSLSSLLVVANATRINRPA